MIAEWSHVADLASLQRDRNSEIRLRLVESRKGFAVEIRKYEISHHRDDLRAGGPGLMVFAERLPELLLALDKAREAIAALQGAQR